MHTAAELRLDADSEEVCYKIYPKQKQGVRRYGAMLRGSASQGGKEPRKTESVKKCRPIEKHRKASQGRKDRSTFESNDSKKLMKRRQYHKKAVRQFKLTSRNLCWLDHNRVRTDRNAHTDTYMHVHIHRALFRKSLKPHWYPAVPSRAEHYSVRALRCKRSPSLRLLVSVSPSLLPLFCSSLL